MGFSLTSIPFFTDDIPMTVIESATHAEVFALEGQPIRAVIKEQRASLQKFDDKPGHYLLTLEDGSFIDFFE